MFCYWRVELFILTHQARIYKNFRTYLGLKNRCKITTFFLNRKEYV